MCVSCRRYFPSDIRVFLFSQALTTCSPAVSVPTRLTFTNSYVLPTQLYLCVLCGAKNKQQYFALEYQLILFYNRYGVCLQRGTDCIFNRNSR
jgi:hypothetical protein